MTQPRNPVVWTPPDTEGQPLTDEQVDAAAAEIYDALMENLSRAEAADRME